MTGKKHTQTIQVQITPETAREKNNVQFKKLKI